MPVHRIAEFDTWRPNYGLATVSVIVAGTTSTLASLFEDEALDVAASNPQTLLETTDADGCSYGKFAKPLYTASPYFLDIDSVEQTGIERPEITTLVGEDASKAKVTALGGTESRDLDEIVGRVVHAENHGKLDAADGATTNATIVAAIGKAAALGGGRVIMPAGTWPFTAFTPPAGVVVEGQGDGVTVLQSQTAGDVVTIGGDGAGLASLTLDGVNLTAGSKGVYSKAKNYTVFDDVTVKRFDVGLHKMGGRGGDWHNFTVDGCNTNVQLDGDLDTGGGSDGDEIRHNVWHSGRIRQSINFGARLRYIDKIVAHSTFRNVGFEDNIGTALDILGARYTALPGCWFTGNTKNIVVADDSPANDDNTVRGFHMPDGYIKGGTLEFSGECEDIVFERTDLSDVDITLTTPGAAILARDCTEDALVTINGDGTKWTRFTSIDDGATVGITTDATATKAWSKSLEPGQVVYLEGKAIGNQRNGISTAEYHIAVSAERPGSTLAYDTQTADFTVGDILTGATSEATALIIADADGGATGTLTLRNIDGEFVDNEAITDGSGGAALANGVLVHKDAALLGAVANLRAVREDVAAWAATFVANGPEIECQVTGAAATTVEWLIHVQSVG